MPRLFAAAVLLAISAAPASAHHRPHLYVHAAAMSYLHNYGPGPVPGSVATYDGPLRVNCKLGAAAYRGQDGRPHPCN